jgi:ribosomal protein S18 acetylase RimI-like enzyme
MTERQFLFHAANPRSMGGVSTHTLEAWAPEHVDTAWAQARPEERNRYAGSSADPGHRPIASMSWHHQTGEVKGVYTSAQFQRQGHATALWQRGNEIATETRGVKSPRHSSFRTSAGDAWAKSVGGRLPKRDES